MSNVSTADFQNLLTKRLRDDGWSVEEVGPLEIRIAPRGEQSAGVFNLSNMYQQYLNGALINHIVEALVRSLQEVEAATRTDAALETSRLMPLLKPRALLDEIARSELDEIAWGPFVSDDVIVALVLDYPQSVRYVRASEAEGLNQPFDDLLEIALGNLYTRTGGDIYEIGDDKTGKIFILATQDGYDATRILLKPLLENLSRRVDGALVIGIPNRDFFIAFGNANPLLVGQIGQQVRKDMRTRTYPLTGTLFMFRNGELEVYEANGTPQG